jgi:hypothetical protein
MRKVFVHIVFPLLFGGLIYAFFRPRVWVMDLVPQDAWLNWMGDHVTLKLAPWLTGSFPDFLWAYAFGSFIILLVREARIIGLLLPSVVGLLHELGQGFGAFPGTFDLLDIVCYLLCVPVLFSFHRTCYQIHSLNSISHE